MSTRSLKTGNSASLAVANSSVAKPTEPTIGTSTASTTALSVSVAFTPSTLGSAATSFIATSTPEGKTGTASSSPINVTGLSADTAYTFKVASINANGTGVQSASSASTSTIVIYLLSQTFNSSGTFTVPSGKNQVAVVLVGSGGAGSAGIAGSGNGSAGGAGGKGGGAVAFKDLSVTPGDTFSVTVGSQTDFSNYAVTNLSNNVSTSNVAGAVTVTPKAAGTGGAGATSDPASNGAGGNTGAAPSNITLSTTGIANRTSGSGGGGGGGGAKIAGNINFSTNVTGGTGGTGGTGAGTGGTGAGWNYIYPQNPSAVSATAGGAANTIGSGGGGGGGGAGSFAGNTNGSNGGNGVSGRVEVYVKQEIK